MRKILLLALVVIGCTQTIKLPPEVVTIIQKENINIADYPWAAQELQEHIAACGQAVVEGVSGVNKCGYTIKVDQLFIENPTLKNGLMIDPEWFEKEGVQWFEPSGEEIRDVPETWSILGVGAVSQVPVNRQRCGDCWSQATTKALEIMIAATDSKVIPLSVQTQISKCSNHGSCGGGYMSAPNFLVEYGNPLESQDPYQGQNSSCKFNMQTDPPFEYRLESAPYVGSSLMYSRFFKGETRRPTVKQIQAAMVKYRSPAVVTIAAISSSGGIIDTCSAVNSGGNHMQDIVGWYPNGETIVADVWNSWGTSHGKDGRTQIKWECPNGGLNRGLGVAARVYVYKPDCVNQPDPHTGPSQDFMLGTYVKLGKAATNGQKCHWTPQAGLLDPNACETFASPPQSTEYHLEATTECGRKSAMVLVRPVGPIPQGLQNEILTPFGKVRIR